MKTTRTTIRSGASGLITDPIRMNIKPGEQIEVKAKIHPANPDGVCGVATVVNVAPKGRAGGLAKSAAKRRAARLNGSAPPAPGKRRGRPPVPRCPVCGGRMPHRESAARFAAGQEQLRSSMDEVAKLLRHSADGIERMADGMRYDEPRGVRHAIDVHVNLLRDLADELARPGQTKYSPNP